MIMMIVSEANVFWDVWVRLKQLALVSYIVTKKF